MFLDFIQRVKTSWSVASFPLGLVIGLLLFVPLFGGPKTIVVDRPVEVVKEVVVTKPVEVVKVVETATGKKVFRFEDKTKLNRCLVALDTAEANRLNLKHLLDTLKPGN